MKRGELKVVGVGIYSSTRATIPTSVVHLRQVLDKRLVKALTDDEVLLAQFNVLQNRRDHHVRLLLANEVEEHDDQVGENRTEIQVVYIADDKQKTNRALPTGKNPVKRSLHVLSHQRKDIPVNRRTEQGVLFRKRIQRRRTVE